LVLNVCKKFVVATVRLKNFQKLINIDRFFKKNINAFINQIKNKARRLARIYLQFLQKTDRALACGASLRGFKSPRAYILIKLLGIHKIFYDFNNISILFFYEIL